VLSESVSENVLKSVNIWQSYKQDRGCLMHFVRLANTPLKDETKLLTVCPVAINFAMQKVIVFDFTSTPLSSVQLNWPAIQPVGWSRV